MADADKAEVWMEKLKESGREGSVEGGREGHGAIGVRLKTKEDGSQTAILQMLYQFILRRLFAHTVSN